MCYHLQRSGKGEPERLLSCSGFWPAPHSAQFTSVSIWKALTNAVLCLQCIYVQGPPLPVTCVMLENQRVVLSCHSPLKMKVIRFGLWERTAEKSLPPQTGSQNRLGAVASSIPGASFLRTAKLADSSGAELGQGQGKAQKASSAATERPSGLCSQLLQGHRSPCKAGWTRGLLIHQRGASGRTCREDGGGARKDSAQLKGGTR